MNPNETTPPVDDEGHELLELNDEGRRALADMKWIDRQHWLGTFDPYAGEYVGVFEQQIVGHNSNLIQLRVEVERERGITPNQLAVTYVPDAKGTGVGRVWLA